MRLRSWFPLLLLPLFGGVALSAEQAPVPAVPAAAWPALAPDKDLEIIARVTANIISREHYRRQPLDQELSGRLFAEYLRVLDPGKVYFAQEDVAALSDYRLKLGEQLQQGNLSFPFAAYRRLLEKVAAYRQYVDEVLAQELDFTVDEEVVLDRSKLPWQTAAELRESWRQRVKNDVLNLRLMRRAAAAGEMPAQASPWGEKAPAAVVRDRAARYCQLLAENDPSDVLELYLTALADVYDPHSAYMSPATTEDFNIQMKLSLAGVGAVLRSEDGYTQVTSIIEGGPAARDGRLQPEDRIIAVGQGDDAAAVDVQDMPLNKVVQLIRGEVGTKVRLTVLPAKQGLAAMPVVIELVRDQVKLTEQEAKGEVKELVLPGDQKVRIGIIELPSFYIDFAAAYQSQMDYKSSTRDVRRLLDEFQRAAPLDGLVIDLRRNGGGSLQEAIALTGLLIDQKPVVQVRQSSGRIEVLEDDDPGVVYSGPLLVLTSRISASAAEIFAGAIQDYGRGLIVGDARTHGKGSVQTIIELDPILRHYGLGRKAGAVRLTNAMFYRISGDSNQRRGVVPDLVFPSYTDAMDIGEEHLDYALPWTQVPPAKYVPATDLASRLAELRERSATRRAASPGFRALEERIARFRQLRDQKAASLNEERRWSSYLEEKRMEEEQLRLLRVDDQGGAEQKRKDKPAEPDLFLEEGQAILLDLVELVRSDRAAAGPAPEAATPAPPAADQP